MAVADAPLMAAEEAHGLAQKVRVFVAMARESAAGGISVAEFGELMLALLRICVAAADSIPAAGAERKAWVMEAAGVLFDEVADFMVPTIAKPFWLLFRPGVRSLVLSAVSGIVESLLPLVREATV